MFCKCPCQITGRHVPEDIIREQAVFVGGEANQVPVTMCVCVLWVRIYSHLVPHYSNFAFNGFLDYLAVDCTVVTAVYHMHTHTVSVCFVCC